MKPLAMFLRLCQLGVKQPQGVAGFVGVSLLDIVYDSRATFRHSHRNLLAWSFKNAQIGERCGSRRYGGNAEKELVEKQG